MSDTQTIELKPGQMVFANWHLDIHSFGERGGSAIVYYSQHDGLEGVLEDITAFLRGCGFVIDGHLDIVKEDDDGGA